MVCGVEELDVATSLAQSGTNYLVVEIEYFVQDRLVVRDKSDWEMVLHTSPDEICAFTNGTTLFM
jgi:hypothetical protein